MKASLLPLVPLLLPVLARSAGDPLPPLTFPDAGSVAHLQLRNCSCEWKETGKVLLSFAKATWPNVNFRAGHSYASADWSQAGALAIELCNPDDAPLSLAVRVDDSPLANGSVHCLTRSATLEAGERTTLLVPLNADAPGMRAGPPYDCEGPSRAGEGGGEVDCAHIVAFQILLPKPERARKLELRGIRWLPRADLRGIVDRFGQFTRADWPGKVQREEDLADARSQEGEWLRQHPPLADRDGFGGWKNGPQLPATGFFRTERVDGRWWLVTPEGRLFWSIGIDCVRPQEQSPLRGREALFSWLPDGAARRGAVDFYQANLARKYGESWESEWARLACERLPAWGFNTIGNWSHESVFRLKRVPYTATVHLSGLPGIGSPPEPGKHDRRLLDYFDERFPGKADAAVAKAVAPWKDDPWCLGFFVDNELSWDSWAQGGLGQGTKVARETLASPESLPARRFFVGQLRARYGTVEAFAKSWNIAVSSWDEPFDVTGKALPSAAVEDCSAFLTAMAERYFSVVRESLRRHAPRHLYLGCRFSVRPPQVVAVAAKYCDVLSFNIYEYEVSPEKWSFTSELGKPVVIGEFHFGALDRGMFHTGLRRTASQEARAQAFCSYVRSVLAQPAFVGCHWFQYADQPLTGRFDGENYNIGFVTITDAPHPELRDAARDLNSQIYAVRSGIAP